jgi:VanZ family protein
MNLFRGKMTSYVWFILIVGVTVQSILPYASTKIAGTFINKILHVGCFFILAFLPAYDFMNRSQGIYVALSMAILGYALQYLHNYIPGRHYFAVDMIANNIGVALGLVTGLIARFFRRIHRAH